MIIEYPDGKIVLVERGVEPFKGKWAVPGGGVEIGETVENAARREAKEETGLDIKLKKVVGIYSDPHRDPRGHTVSIVYLAEPVGGELKADTDAADAIITDDFANRDLAFDHRKMLQDAFPEKF
jgi:8-oxo-dGTP diphosphatase